MAPLLRALACVAAVLALASAKQYPARRTYDSHAYYVLELSGDEPLSAHEIAHQLSAEHVEQVGELRHHYLIRATKDLVGRGDKDWEAVTALAVNRRDLGTGSSVSNASQHAARRDTVLERYELLKREHVKMGTLQARAVSHPAAFIRSLERQEPRQRVKRDMPLEIPRSVYPLTQREPRHLEAGSRHKRAYPSKMLPDPTGPLISQIASYFGIADPLFPKQWHLLNDRMEENSVNVTGVWDDGVFGDGVNVAIVDDGLDMHSDDLSPNFHADGSWDYNDHTPLPEPRLSDDQHGTRCAGEIAASKNSVCGVGVAHKAGIAGIRILSGAISDADEASSLNYGYQTNDIYSCSWGPPDDGRSMEAPNRLITKAMLNGIQNGRAGKGSIYVFASGNGGAMDDQCNFDGYTNSLMSITVGAIDRKGQHPFYSEACAANMVVTYSSGSGDNIHTTDVGKNACTDRHGGTSAAAPLAAGIFALALEVRPELTWRDMQHLCVQTAVQINPEDHDWQMTPSGRYYNHKFGWGKLDAWAIVNAAKTFELVKPQAWYESPTKEVGAPITPEGATSKIDITNAELKKANFELLEHITVTVNITHERRGNVEVELHSPRGMVSILARPRRFDEASSGFPGWVFMTVKHWDEDPIGEWTLMVRDRQKVPLPGALVSWSMHLWGSSIDAKKAKPYVMEDDAEIILPPQPHDTAVVTTSTVTSSEFEPTRSIARPTEHLPDDHSDASATRVSTTPTPTPTPAPVGDDENEDVVVSSSSISSAGSTEGWSGYLSGVPGVMENSTWLFVALGAVIIFGGGATAFFCMRNRKGRVAFGRGEFAPIAGDEDMAMSSLERGRLRLMGKEPTRTRDLYDAFALEGSDEESETDETDRERPLLSGSGRRSIALRQDAMRSYHDQESSDDTPAPAAAVAPARTPSPSPPRRGPL